MTDTNDPDPPELAQALADENSLEEVLQRLVDGVASVLTECVAASVTVIEEGRLRTAVRCGDLAWDLDRAQYLAGSGPCLWALRAGKVVHSQQDPAWARFADAAAARGVASLLCVPLLVGEVCLGTLNLYSDRDDGLADEAAQGTAALLAAQGAHAFAAVRALRTEHRLAVELQQKLLPWRMPDIDGYDLAARYRPAEATAEVGGDWYDAVLLGPEGPLMAVVGDVSGHGLSAAATMAQVRSAVRAYVLEGHDPATCLMLVSRFTAALDTARETMLATACTVLVDLLTGMCRLASAGHPPVVELGPDGTVRFVALHGAPPLGVDGFQPPDSEFAFLAPGGALVLFTDGLVEDRSLSLEAGLEQLATALCEPFSSAAELADRVVGEMLSGRLQEDDVAVLVIARRP